MHIDDAYGTHNQLEAAWKDCENIYHEFLKAIDAVKFAYSEKLLTAMKNHAEKMQLAPDADYDYAFLLECLCDVKMPALEELHGVFEEEFNEALVTANQTIEEEEEEEGRKIYAQLRSDYRRSVL